MTSRAALEIILQARDEASRVVTGAADSFGTLSKSVGQVAQDLRPVGELLAGIGAAGALAIGEATSEAIEFNAQAALMGIAAGDAAVGFDALHDAAIAVGGDTRLVGVSASGAADSITELYRAGLDTTEIFGDLNSYMSENAELGGVLRGSIDLAAASDAPPWWNQTCQGARCGPSRRCAVGVGGGPGHLHHCHSRRRPALRLSGWWCR